MTRFYALDEKNSSSTHSSDTYQIAPTVLSAAISHFRATLLPVFCMLMLTLITFRPADAQSVVINEFMASNSETIADADGDYPDWIEIFNAGSQSVALEGYGLSDNASNRFKWTFPEVTLQPGEFLLVWASGKDRFEGVFDLHTNFAISSSGEPLVLTHRDGTLLDSIPPIVLQTDVAYARYPDGTGDFLYTENPTPGAPNTSDGFTAWLEAPVFSAKPGFFDSGFTLSLSTPDEGVTIRYTTDGTRPTSSSAVYNPSEGISIQNRTQQPNNLSMIPTNAFGSDHPYREHWREPDGNVFKGTVVRAKALRTGARTSEITTGAFFVDPQGSDRFGVPVLSISTDPGNFFDPDSGIYVQGNQGNFNQRGREWEREIHFQMMEPDGSIVVSQEAGARIHGGTSRSRPLKSLRLYARNDYGETWFDYPIFPDKPVTRYKRLLLRNSGNDWSESMLRDLFMQDLLKSTTSLDIQYGRTAVVFLNGEYWGIHNIRDRFDDRYLQSHYGLQEDDITMLETIHSGYGQFVRGNPTGTQHFSDLMNLMVESIPQMNQSSRLQTIESMMDVDNFIEYQASQIYFRNTDWPGNNQIYWRYSGPEESTDVNDDRLMPNAAEVRDGRWRWMVFDVDFGFGLDFDYVRNSGSQYGENNAQHNTLAFALQSNGPGWPNPPFSTEMFRSLMFSDAFKARFTNRMADLLNSAFRADHVVAKLDSVAAVYRPLMEEHIRRWGEPANMQTWEHEIQRMKNFASDREAAVRGHTAQRLNVGPARQLTVNVTDDRYGSIQVNSITVDASLPGAGTEPYPWSGYYFEQVPVQLIAHPAAGYRLETWLKNGTPLESTSDTISISLDGNHTYKARFIRDSSLEIDDMNPGAWPLSEGAYRFDTWFDVFPTGTFPENMVFQQSNMDDPGLDDPMTAPYDPGSDLNNEDADFEGFPYRLTRRTRINGLGTRGISLINTGRGRDLGAAVLALDLMDVNRAEVEWLGGTEQANSRVYAIRLQGRIGHESDWEDLQTANGEPIEYMRNAVNGHEALIGPHELPAAFMNQPYVQLRWKYYYTGERLSQDSGQRDMLRLDNIEVRVITGSSTEPGNELPAQTKLHPNSPNPFNPETLIRYTLATDGQVSITVYNLVGQRVATLADGHHASGHHQVRFNAENLASGVYLVRLQTTEGVFSRKMMLIK